jgi:hypothetical protein
MSMFGKLIRTAVNVVALPVEVVKDVVTLGNIASGDESYTVQRIQKLKEEAEDE